MRWRTRSRVIDLKTYRNVSGSGDVQLYAMERQVLYVQHFHSAKQQSSISIFVRVPSDILFSPRFTVRRELKWQVIDRVQCQARSPPQPAGRYQRTRSGEAHLWINLPRKADSRAFWDLLVTPRRLIAPNGYPQAERVQPISEIT